VEENRIVRKEEGRKQNDQKDVDAVHVIIE
jgi:hypothetical protein